VTRVGEVAASNDPISKQPSHRHFRQRLSMPRCLYSGNGIIPRRRLPAALKQGGTSRLARVSCTIQRGWCWQWSRWRVEAAGVVREECCAAVNVAPSIAGW